MTQPEGQENLKKFKQFEKGRDMANKLYKMSWEKQMEDLFNEFKPTRGNFFIFVVLEVLPNHEYILNDLVNTEGEMYFPGL